MEIRDLYDDNKKLTNETIKKGEKVPKGRYYITVVVWIENSNNEFLIQKTSKQKGSYYSTTGGHVIHNETPIESIIREIKEELGLTIGKDNIKFINQEKHPQAPCLFNIYELNMNIDISNLTLQKEEVEKVQWLTKEEVLKLIENKNFLESHGYLFKKYYK